jgi:hypothetical protein
MKTRREMRSLTVAGFLAVLGLASGTRAQEEKIPLHRVPRVVINSAKAKFPGAEIKKASKETEDGEPVFALGMKHHRHDMDVTFKADGTVVLVETAVPAKELPQVVLRAVEGKYPGASIRGAESVTTGPEVKKQADHYEFYLVTADNKPRLVKVDPKGEVLEDPYRRLHHAQPRQPLSRAPGTLGSMTRDDP